MSVQPKEPREKTLQYVVLSHLRRYRVITSKIAFDRYGITRLSDVVFKLRKLGHPIQTVPEKVATRYDHSAMIGKYMLEHASDGR